MDGWVEIAAGASETGMRIEGKFKVLLIAGLECGIDSHFQLVILTVSTGGRIP